MLDLARPYADARDQHKTPFLWNDPPFSSLQLCLLFQRGPPAHVCRCSVFRVLSKGLTHCLVPSNTIAPATHRKKKILSENMKPCCSCLADGYALGPSGYK